MLFRHFTSVAASMPQAEVLDPNPAILQIAVFGFFWPLVERIRSSSPAICGIRHRRYPAGGRRPADSVRKRRVQPAGCLPYFPGVPVSLPSLRSSCAHGGHLRGSRRLAWPPFSSTQPDRGLHTAGIEVFAALGVSAGVAALVAWRGRELAPSSDWDDLEAAPLVASDRARLDAEFEVARHAQEAALPSRARRLSGPTDSPPPASLPSR